MASPRLNHPQIAMDLSPAPAFTFDSFITAPSNQAALALVRAWPNWPAPAILLLGPSGTGKTHLGQAWASDTQGIFLDQVHSETEEALFAAINKALRGDSPGLLMASDQPPSDWGIQLPDLRSRMNAVPVVTLEEPDDDSLRPITRALFQRQGRQVNRDVIDYLLKYTDRSVPALRETIRQIDKAASRAKADVTRPFVASWVKNALTELG